MYTNLYFAAVVMPYTCCGGLESSLTWAVSRVHAIPTCHTCTSVVHNAAMMHGQRGLDTTRTCCKIRMCEIWDEFDMRGMVLSLKMGMG